jgi:RNA polymerase sigma factor (TIGR02999 family)
MPPVFGWFRGDSSPETQHSICRQRSKLERVASVEITGLLRKWSGGDKQALDELTPLVYAELRRLAQRQLRRERADHSFQSTELVNEAYLRMVDQKKAQFHDRTHFYAVSSQIIRRILVDQARKRLSEKRGGGAARLVLDESIDVAQERNLELAALDDALTALAALDSRQSRLVELRFFGGLSIDEAAEVLGVSAATANRDWVAARAWLLRELSRR